MISIVRICRRVYVQGGIGGRRRKTYFGNGH